VRQGRVRERLGLARGELVPGTIGSTVLSGHVATSKWGAVTVVALDAPTSMIGADTEADARWSCVGSAPIAVSAPISSCCACML
jgi:hypothetical protein